MPGYIMHLACAEQVFDICGIKDEQWKNAFRLGSMIPDASVSAKVVSADVQKQIDGLNLQENPRNYKKLSHFWDDDTFKKLNRAPNMKMFLDKYEGKLDDPYVLGYYTHLFLDWIFVEDYWRKHFQFFDEDRKPEEGFNEVAWVKVVDTDCWYRREHFLSNDLYYGDYDKLNDYMFCRYKVSIPYLDDSFTYNQISEVDWNASWDELNRMIARLKGIEVVKEELLTPPLNIFILSDLVSMIETAAKESARYIV